MQTKVLLHEDVADWVRDYGVEKSMQQLISRLKSDYGRWNEFHRVPRLAAHYPHGVVESMPISDDKWYACKLVNGHPENPLAGLMSVYALGVLIDIATGRVRMVTGMTLLTAIRTAAVSAMFLSLCKPKKKIDVGIIGAGAQSEFQLLAIDQVSEIQKVKVYDTDPQSMGKLLRNLSHKQWKIECLDGPEAVVEGCDVLVTATAAKKHADVLGSAQLSPEQILLAIGGDCPGKTELDPMRMVGSKVVVPCIKQAAVEGEIQQFAGDYSSIELKELHECVNSSWLTSNDQLRIFDSVGYALDDYSTLAWLESALEDKFDQDLHPVIEDPKNLFATIR